MIQNGQIPKADRSFFHKILICLSDPHTPDLSRADPHLSAKNSLLLTGFMFIKPSINVTKLAI